MAVAEEALTQAVNNKMPEASELRRDYWRKYQEFQRYGKQIERLHDRFTSKAGKIYQKFLKYEYLSAAMQQDPWVNTDGAATAAWIDNLATGTDVKGAPQRDVRPRADRPREAADRRQQPAPAAPGGTGGGPRREPGRPLCVRSGELRADRP